MILYQQELLELAYDQMLHPQKRILLKDVVLAVLGRLIELKQVQLLFATLMIENGGYPVD